MNRFHSFLLTYPHHSFESLFYLVVCLGCLTSQPLLAAEGQNHPSTQVIAQSSPPAKTSTVVADLLMIDGAFYVVRGEGGEIRIEITPDTQLSEKFKFGDRIKAVLLPDDKALSVTKAQADEPIGTTSASASPSTPPPPAPSASPSQAPSSSDAVPSSPNKSQVRIIVADLLMIDGNLYIIRSEKKGEIQIEVTPETSLSETFKFGDRIKARIDPQDKALSIVRADPGDTPGIRLEGASKSSEPTIPPAATAPQSESAPPQKVAPSPDSSKDSQKIRTVVAEVLMIDGDIYVVRGDRGEIRIEVTPKTTLSETFKFGDKIKAKILPNDKALSIERAGKDEPVGVQKP